MEFRRDFGGWYDTTWRGLSGVLRNLETKFGHVDVSDITPRQIDAYVQVPPTDNLQMKKEQSRVPSALSDEDLEKLLQHCPEPIRTIVAVAADTGMRRSELRLLKWQDVDLASGTLTIRQTKNGH